MQLADYFLKAEHTPPTVSVRIGAVVVLLVKSGMPAFKHSDIRAEWRQALMFRVGNARPRSAVRIYPCERLVPTVAASRPDLG